MQVSSLLFFYPQLQILLPLSSNYTMIQISTSEANAERFNGLFARVIREEYKGDYFIGSEETELSPRTLQNRLSEALRWHVIAGPSQHREAYKKLRRNYKFSIQMDHPAGVNLLRIGSTSRRKPYDAGIMKRINRTVDLGPSPQTETTDEDEFKIQVINFCQGSSPIISIRGKVPPAIMSWFIEFTDTHGVDYLEQGGFTTLQRREEE